MFGTIFDIKKFAIHDGRGIRTTIFFKGCPLDCQWCHNPESRSTQPEELVDYRSCLKNNRKMIGRTISVSQAMAEILKDELFYDETGGGVTFSGGEPMLQIEFLYELLKECHEKGLHTTVDTSGYVEWTDFLRVHKHVNLFLFDLKLISEEQHIEYTTVSNKLILRNLERLSQLEADIRIRIPLIHNITDTDENIDGIISYLDKLSSLRKIDILPYNKLGQDKIQRYDLDRVKLDLSSQTGEKISRIHERLQRRGYDVHVGG